MPGSTVTTMPGSSFEVRFGGQPRGLVDLQADAVAQAMAETAAEAGFGNHGAGHWSTS